MTELVSPHLIKAGKYTATCLEATAEMTRYNKHPYVKMRFAIDGQPLFAHVLAPNYISLCLALDVKPTNDPDLVLADKRFDITVDYAIWSDYISNRVTKVEPHK